jgi:hypothetical protein
MTVIVCLLFVIDNNDRWASEDLHWQMTWMLENGVLVVLVPVGTWYCCHYDDAAAAWHFLVSSSMYFYWVPMETKRFQHCSR